MRERSTVLPLRARRAFLYRLGVPPQPEPSPLAPELAAREGWQLALRSLTSPKDANHQGSVFGGVILSLIDQAGYVEARRHGRHRWVTVAMEAVEFHQPVRLGDVLTLWTKTTRSGRTSVAVDVRVDAERYAGGEHVHVTAARMTLVATNASGLPIPFREPPSMPAEAGGGAS